MPRDVACQELNEAPSTPVGDICHDWSLHQVNALFRVPLMDLVFKAATIHRRHHDPTEVQVCKLISIKTGGCPEDCSYCSQSSRYKTEVKASPLMETDEVLAIARRAKEAGVSRVCMGAAWREVRDNKQFDRVLELVREVNAIGVEVCCTLGMLTEDQARRLEDAGLYAYNHNLDTSREHYGKVITTPHIRPIAWIPSPPSAKPASPSAAAALWASAKPKPIAPRCCTPWPPSTLILNRSP